MKTISATRPPGAEDDAQAVIRQARRRQRRRQLVAGVVAVLAAGGALGGYAASTGTGHPGAARTVSHATRRPPPGPGALGIAATVLLWPVGYPVFGPEAGPPAYLGNLGTGRLVRRQIPGIIGCDCHPYLIAVGHQLIYVGQHGTMAIAADLTGKPRVLGTTQFFAPSAEPGHVWLSYERKTAQVVRLVSVTGGRPGPPITLPKRTRLTQGTYQGLLLARPSGVLQLWHPGHAPTPLPYSANWNDTFAADARIIAYGTGCKNAITGSGTPYHKQIGYDVCQELRVFHVTTGSLDSFRAPPGTAGWVQSGIFAVGMDNAISPRDTMVAAEAVTSPRQGQARLFVLPLGPRHQAPTVVPSSAAFMTTMTTWSPGGSWLFYQGPGGHLWAYQEATGRAQPSAIPCCRYNVMTALSSLP